MTTPRTAFRSAVASVAANERLTVLAALVLIPLLGVEALTAISVRQFLPAHLLVGLWLVPVVAVKLASTGYRMISYYLRDQEYVLAGPPAWIPRLLAPVLVISTIGLFGSGVVLWWLGPAARDPWLAVHKVSFVTWGITTGAHVLIHLRHTIRDSVAELRSAASGKNLRRGLVAGALIVGLVVAVVGFNRGPAWPREGGEAVGIETGQR